MNPQLWNKLLKANLVTGDRPEQVEIGSPWYIKVIMAFSGWLAALFILGILFAIFSRFHRETTLLISFGSGFIVVAYLLLRLKANEFLEHLAFALSLAGMALLAISVDNLVTYHEEATIWLLVAVVQLVLAFIMPNFVHRVFSSFMAAIGFAAALYFYRKSSLEFSAYSIGLMLLTSWFWLNELCFAKHIEKLQAAGYGLVSALIVIKGSNIFMNTHFWRTQIDKTDLNTWFQPWLVEVLLSGVTLYVIWSLFQKTYPKPSHKALIIALIGGVILTLLSTQAQGLMVGIMILLLGFSASNRVLVVLGIIAMLLAISSYYYLLNNTLMEKSLTLLILGVVLIIGRFIMIKFLPNQALQEELQP